MNLYLRVPYFLTDLGELDKEHLHLNANVYQMNQNRSSGNHTVVKGVNRRNKKFARIF
jgi:hypothetical protein